MHAPSQVVGSDYFVARAGGRPVCKECPWRSGHDGVRSLTPAGRGQYLHAPFGPGVYQIRHRSNGDMVLFGSGTNCAQRMSSLLPEPFGVGTRNNSTKRTYLLAHLPDLDYRCVACESRREAEETERLVRREHSYLFAT